MKIVTENTSVGLTAEKTSWMIENGERRRRRRGKRRTLGSGRREKGVMERESLLVYKW